MTAPKTPYYIHLQVTERCNLKCPGCYQVHPAGPELRASQWDELLLKPAQQLGYLHITLTGGEPLLYEDIVGVAGLSVKRGLLTFLVCNGLLLDEQMAKKLIDVGVGQIFVSLDGDKASAHDRIRGKKGVFDLAVANVSRTREILDKRQSETRLGIIHTMFAENVSSWAKMPGLAESIGAHEILFQPHHSYGIVYPRFEKGYNKPQFSKEELESIANGQKALIELKKSNPQLVVNTSDFLMKLSDFWRDPKRIAQKCGAYRYLFLNSAGQVRGCIFSEFFFGLDQISLNEIADTPAMKGFRDFCGGCTICLMGCQYVDDAQLYSEYGKASNTRGETKEALEWYGKSIEKDTSLAYAHHEMGMLLKDMERWEEAEREFTTAAELNPRHPWHWIGRATVLRQKGDLAAALGNLKELLEGERRIDWTEQSFQEARRIMGWVLLESGKPEPAWNAFLKAGTPEIQYLYPLAKALGKAGKWNRYVEAQERIIAIDSDSVRPHIDLANMYAKKAKPFRAFYHGMMAVMKLARRSLKP
jgi:MoaA/NifB/PqqE/SkfB family radical SAM enzyme